VGHLIDVRNIERKIIAEIKNKYNTTKGSDKKALYDNLEFALKGDYAGYTGYYVEIIPRNCGTYDKPFTPSDNKLKNKRAEDENIRVIDGCSFYELATGDEYALQKLYKILPTVIREILGNNFTLDYRSESLFHELYSRAFIK